MPMTRKIVDPPPVYVQSVVARELRRLADLAVQVPKVDTRTWFERRGLA